MFSSERRVIFDFDDTLVETAFFYWEATDRFVEFMGGLGFDTTETRERFTTHLAKQAEAHGFADRSRFPQSMDETLVAMVGEGRARSETYPQGVELHNLRAKARSIGYSVFRRKSPLKADAHETLGSLTLFGYELSLLTMGDPQVQNKRIDQAGIRHYFSDVRIVPRKSEDVLREYVGSRIDSWLVGDSMRSDIVPAVAVGLRAILVGQTSQWGYECQRVEDGYWKAATLTDAAGIILNEDGLV